MVTSPPINLQMADINLRWVGKDLEHVWLDYIDSGSRPFGVSFTVNAFTVNDTQIYQQTTNLKTYISTTTFNILLERSIKLLTLLNHSASLVSHTPCALVILLTPWHP